MGEEYKKLRLASGLNLLLVPLPSVESVTVLVMVRTGSRDEPSKLAGISHFVEHMVFKGTRKYSTPFALTSAIDSIGGEFNAFTSKEYTGFYVKVAAKYLEKGMDVLAQMVTEPLFEEDAINREKGVVIEEINMYEDLPMQKVTSIFDRLLFGNNSLGRDTIGSKKTVRAINKSNLTSYLKERYTTGRTVIGVVGGVHNKQAVKSVKELLENEFVKMKINKENSWKGKVIADNKKPNFQIFKKDTEQTHFVLGVPSFARGHRDRYALAVLSTILGGNMSSRLFTEIREKRGLAYYIRTDTDSFFETGSFTVHAGVDTSKIEDAVKVAIDELNKVQERQGRTVISQDEVERAKEYLKGSLILDLENSHEVADLYVRKYLLERKIMTPRRMLEKIEAVDLDDVVRVAEKLLSRDKLHLAIVGPLQEKSGQELSKLLKL